MSRTLLQKIKLHWLTILPIVISNLYSLIGVLFLHWSVADIYFWFWFEFFLVGITANILTFFWLWRHPELHPALRSALIWTVTFGFFYPLIFATLFSAGAYYDEWHDWSLLPQFISRKNIGILAYVLSAFITLGTTLLKREYIKLDDKSLLQGIVQHGIIIVILYLIFLVNGWLSEAMSNDFHKVFDAIMGSLLISIKLIVEFILIIFPLKSMINRT